MNPTISVIIPVYNEADVLAETLSSLAGQTLADFEAILIDDGSTDDSRSICEAAAASDARFRLHAQVNAGAAAARNVGLELARGTYVLFLDADDLFSPHLLERLRDALETSNCDLCVSEADIWRMGEPGPKAFFRFPPEVAEGRHVRAEFGRTLFQSFNKTVWNKLYRRERLLASPVRFQDLPNMNDLYFVEMTLATSETICVLKEPLVTYRRGRGASIQDLRHTHPACALDAADALFRDLTARGTLDAEETVSLRNECLRLAIQAVESAAVGKDVEVTRDVLERARRLMDAWGVCDLARQDLSVGAWALWRWSYLNADAEHVVWAYAYPRRPVAERQTTLANLRCAARLALAGAQGRLRARRDA